MVRGHSCYGVVIETLAGLLNGEINRYSQKLLLVLMVSVPKRESKSACDDQSQDARFHGARRKQMSQSGERADRCWHTGDARRDAAIKNRLQGEMMHDRGLQLPEEAD